MLACRRRHDEPPHRANAWSRSAARHRAIDSTGCRQHRRLSPAPVWTACVGPGHRSGLLGRRVCAGATGRDTCVGHLGRPRLDHPTSIAMPRGHHGHPRAHERRQLATPQRPPQATLWTTDTARHPAWDTGIIQPAPCRLRTHLAARGEQPEGSAGSGGVANWSSTAPRRSERRNEPLGAPPAGTTAPSVEERGKGRPPGPGPPLRTRRWSYA